MAAASMLANNAPVILSFLVETQQEIEATGYIELDAKGFFLKTVSGDHIYFESSNNGLAKLHANRTFVRVAAFINEDQFGKYHAKSFVLTHLEFGTKN